MSSHVLVVEDDPDMLEIIAAILGAEGYAYRTAHNGVEALDAVNGERPAVVLLDMLMPVMNGWQTAAELHHRYGRTVPIVAVTAAEHAEAAATEIGADDVLAKPFEIDDLLRVVSRYCRRPGAGVLHRTA
jgi:DNA-binding response OmpR family regulator